MPVFDISVPIHPAMHVYPGDAAVELSQTASISRGDLFNTSRLAFTAHCGTHVDAPRHILPNGLTVDELPLDVLVGKAVVVALPDEPVVTASALARARIPDGTERVLLKTRNSELWRREGFQRGFAYLTPEAAQYLVARRVRLVGIDYLSIEGYGVAPPQTHWALLRHGVVVVEGLDLSGVEPGEYTLACLPLRVRGADGAPARAALTKEKSSGNV
ncbi:MAG: cyclase family protein [Chloroflexi bacterium]|nr:cyclase family protein [Chloroflexota bacterium]